jgi:hypothetical protein
MTLMSGMMLAKQWGLALLLPFLMLLTTDVHANQIAATSCDWCDDGARTNAAVAAAPPWNGVYDVYVTDNGRRTIEKFEVTIENEPGFSLSQATRVSVEPDVSDFVARYWSTIDQFAAPGLEIHPVHSPTLVDFLGNSAVRGDTRFYVQSQLEGLLSFPRSFGVVIHQLSAGRFPALPSSGIVITLTFPDGGTVKVELTLHIDISTSTVGITEMKIVEGTAWLGGISVPTSPVGFHSYEREATGSLIEDLVRLARRWGIPVNCVPSSRSRLSCDSQGNCRVDVVGSCN